MLFNISVITNAKVEKVEAVNETTLRVKVMAKPVDGAANLSLIRLLAVYFNVPPSVIKIKRGFNSRYKVVSID